MSQTRGKTKGRSFCLALGCPTENANPRKLHGHREPIGNGKLKTEGTVHAVCGQTEEPSLHLDMSPRKTEANGCGACDDASGEPEIVNGEPVDE